MRYVPAFLNLPPDVLIMGWGQLGPERADWIQATDRWTMILYRTKGVLLMNGKGYPYEPGDVVLFPPGVRGGHTRVEEGTQVLYATFDLPDPSRLRVALPLLSKADAKAESDFEFVAKRMTTSSARGKAFVWNYLWALSQPPSVFRDQEEMYEAERWILEHLQEPFQIADLVEALAVPHRSLLRWFKAQHGTTIKQYATERRVREACRLLAESELSVKAIAQRVGIPDLHQFNKTIRGAVGLSPREVRKRSG